VRAGWSIKPLGEVCDFQRGLAYAKTDEVGVSSNIVLRANNIDLGTNLLDLSELKYISDSVAVPASKKVKKDSLLICTASGSKSHLGKIAFIDDDYDFAFGGFMGMLTPNANVFPRYLFHLMTSSAYKDFIAALSDGANINNLKFSDLQQFSVPVPTLPEQHRIVAILDAAFDGIAIAKANAEQNLQNARALFESHLQKVFTERGEGWVEKKLGHVCSIARGGSPRPIQKFLTTAPDGINWIKIGDATASGKYIYKTEEKIIPEGARRSRMVHDGDFLLSNSMSFGRPYIMRTSGCIHDGWLVLSDYAAHLDQDYLYYVLGSQFVYRQFDRLAAGSTVRNLNKELASRASIPVPPRQRQYAIAKEFETISEEIRNLESLYQQKLTALDELKKSLLHRAFSGRL